MARGSSRVEGQTQGGRPARAVRTAAARPAMDDTRPIGAASDGEARLRSRDRHELIGWIARYLDQLRPRERSTKRGYQDWAAGNDGAPYASAFDQYGGWNVLRREAQEQQRHQQRHEQHGEHDEHEHHDLDEVDKVVEGDVEVEDQVKHEVADHDNDHVIVAPDQRRRVRPGERRVGRAPAIPIEELIASGLLRLDEELTGSYRGQSWSARYDKTSGKIVTGAGDSYSSLTAAATAVRGAPMNGFEFWCVHRNGRVVSLKKLGQ